jgi:hypothetical protein
MTATESVAFYDKELALNLGDLGDLLANTSEIRSLHNNGAARHLGYIALMMGGNQYEVGTLVIDQVNQDVLVFHRETYFSLADARTALKFRVDRGY